MAFRAQPDCSRFLELLAFIKGLFSFWERKNSQRYHCTVERQTMLEKLMINYSVKIRINSEIMLHIWSHRFGFGFSNSLMIMHYCQCQIGLTKSSSLVISRKERREPV